MEHLSKNGVIDLIVKNEIGYYENGIFEVRSFWKNHTEKTSEKNISRHFCSVQEKEIEIPLYSFKTLYGRFWKIGGCKICKKLIYHPIPLDEE